MITVNARILSTRLTGAQRYLLEMLNRMPDIRRVEPMSLNWSRGIKGHAWEQFVLPSKVRGTLWSPSNSGPIFKADQIVSILDVVPLEHPEWVGKKFAEWYKFMMPKVVKTAKHVITISEFSKAGIVKYCGIKEDKISVAYCGVDERFSKATDSDGLAARLALKIPYSRYVLIVGSIEPRKNVERALAAWAGLEHLLSEDIGLVIAGSVGAEQVFGKFDISETANRVHFTGHVPDQYLAGLYKGADIFMYLSVYEGFGLPVLEAMMAGTPVICGNLTALPEVVGDAALSVDPYSIDQIKVAIRHLLDSGSARTELSSAGLLRAKTFSWECAANIHKGVFAKYS